MGQSVFSTTNMYNQDKKLCVKWNDFQENVSSAFKECRQDMEFADVTLACEDGQQVEAHKVILASASPFFLDLLRKTKHPKPLIYMRGLKSEDLVAMVDFLYCGEANVFKENLDSFLSVAEDFKLKGLSGNKKHEVETSAPNPTNNIKKPLSRKWEETDLTKAENPEEDLAKTGNVAVTDYIVTADLQGLDARVKPIMENGDTISDGRQNRASRVCKLCGKQGTDSDIKIHIEANHHTCNICGKTSKSRDGLRKHLSIYHN